MQTTKITSQGQITIPAKVRNHFGLVVGDTVGFDIADNGIVTFHRLRTVHHIEPLNNAETQEGKNNADRHV